MNIITYKATYSFFLHATFEEKRNLATGSRKYDHSHLLEKYKERRWKPVYRILSRHQEDIASSFRYEKHWTRDNKTWILPLDVSKLGVTDRTSAYDSIETTSFDVAISIQDLKPDIRFIVLKDQRLADYVFVTNVMFAKKLEGFADVMGRIDQKRVQITPDGYVFGISSL